MKKQPKAHIDADFAIKPRKEQMRVGNKKRKDTYRSARKALRQGRPMTSFRKKLYLLAIAGSD